MSREKNIFSTLVFNPSTLRTLSDGSHMVEGVSLAGTEKTQGVKVGLTTGTFRYDTPGSAIKSTQQLNVDFSKFENHTFFNSAESKVQVAFEKIINRYPFDEDKTERIRYLDGLSGFQRWVLSRFPQNVGSLIFSGTQKGEDPDNGYDDNLGTHLTIQDYKGTSMATEGMAGSGETVLDFSLKPFTIEFHLYVPSGSQNDNQIVLQKIQNTNHGYTVALSSSHSLTSPLGKVNLKTIVSSGSNAVSSSVRLSKGKFYHVTSIYDKYSSESILTYLDGQLAGTSSMITL